MVSSSLLPYEPYVLLFYAIHMAISLVLAFFLSFYTSKRFRMESEAINKRDKRRLEGVVKRGFIFKRLFSVSLHKNNRKSNIVFIFLFNLAIPLIGYLFSLWIVWYLKNITYEKKVSNTNILNLDEFSSSFLKVERIFGEGSMIDLMNSKHAPRSKKLKALSSLSSSLSPANLRIIRSTLSSTDDEIRMFGYATINKAEKNISIKINDSLELYRIEGDDEKSMELRAKAAKELAELYWEMVYTELSHESLKGGFMIEIKKYLIKAKEFYTPHSEKLEGELKKIIKKHQEVLAYEKEHPNEKSDENENSLFYEAEVKKASDKVAKYNDIETKLYVLMGKVYMIEKDYERAITEFTAAQELYDGTSSFIVPYLAEIYFLMGNYSIVRAIMRDSEELALNATLYPIVQQWKSS